MSGIVVDCHSHVFNAEDIPIDGFLKRRLPAPSLLAGVLSGPLDLVASARAPGAEEAATLLVLIPQALDGGPGEGGLEGVAGDQPDEILSDEELDARLVQYLAVERPVPPDGQPEDGGQESVGDAEDAITALIADASPEQLAELDEWLGAWEDPDLASDAGEEGVIDDLRPEGRRPASGGSAVPRRSAADHPAAPSRGGEVGRDIRRRPVVRPRPGRLRPHRA